MGVVIVLGLDEGVLEVFERVTYVVDFRFLVLRRLVLEVVADVLDILAEDAAKGGQRAGRHRDVLCRIFKRDGLGCECKPPEQCKLCEGCGKLAGLLRDC